MSKVWIEGYILDEILELPEQDIDQLAFCDESLVLRAEVPKLGVKIGRK